MEQKVRRDAEKNRRERERERERENERERERTGGRKQCSLCMQRASGRSRGGGVDGWKAGSKVAPSQRDRNRGGRARRWWWASGGGAGAKKRPPRARARASERPE